MFTPMFFDPRVVFVYTTTAVWRDSYTRSFGASSDLSDFVHVDSNTVDSNTVEVNVSNTSWHFTNSETINNLSMSNDGIVSAGLGETSIFVWNYDSSVPTVNQGSTPTNSSAAGSSSVDVSGDGSYVIVGRSGGGDVEVWLNDLSSRVGFMSDSSSMGNSVSSDETASTIAVGDASGQQVFVYTESSGSWNLTTTLTNTNEPDFGWKVALSQDGTMLFITAGDNSTNSYYYEFDGSTWIEQQQLQPIITSYYYPSFDYTGVYLFTGDMIYEFDGLTWFKKAGVDFFDTVKFQSGTNNVLVYNPESNVIEHGSLQQLEY